MATREQRFWRGRALRAPIPMLKLRFILPALALLSLAPSASAADVTLNITAHDPGSAGGWFEVEGYEGRNPRIQLAVGDNVTVNFVNEGVMEHNVRFAPPLDARGKIVQKGGETTLEFTVPEDAPATIPYWCDPHRAIGMHGMIDVEGGRPVAEAPGVGWIGLLAATGIALAVRGQRN